MKKLLKVFVGIIDKEESIGRRYSDIVLSLCQIAARELETKDYRIMVDRHDSKSELIISRFGKHRFA